MVRPPWFSKPVRTGSEATPDRVGQHLADGPRPDALHGVDLEQPDALVRFGVRSGEAPAHHLEPGAHGQHDRAAAHLIAAACRHR